MKLLPRHQLDDVCRLRDRYCPRLYFLFNQERCALEFPWSLLWRTQRKPFMKPCPPYFRVTRGGRPRVFLSKYGSRSVSRSLAWEMTYPELRGKHLVNLACGMVEVYSNKMYHTPASQFSTVHLRSCVGKVMVKESCNSAKSPRCQRMGVLTMVIVTMPWPTP